MTTLDYNIISPEAERIDWLQCTMIIELNKNFFHYIILHASQTIVALKYYRISLSSERTVVELLEEIVAGDELLGKNIPVSAIIYNMPESHLVPALFFNEEMNKDLLAIVHGDLRKDVVLWERILNLDMYNIYLIPGEI
ncbi:MAG: DUF3822 family protein, partial [Chitinophagaceae bacterium]|nr:DUF3822 family protein [Chitinophagaceae bacterium]